MTHFQTPQSNRTPAARPALPSSIERASEMAAEDEDDEDEDDGIEDDEAPKKLPKRPSYGNLEQRRKWIADRAAEIETLRAAGTEEDALPEPWIDPIDASVFNSAGKLLRVGSDYNEKIHKAPKRSQFADETVFMEWKAAILEETASKLANRATKLREHAETLRQIGNPEQRKTAQKVLKQRDALMRFVEQARKEGMSDDQLRALGLSI